MGLDIRTLTFILGLLHVLPIAVFAHQYRTNRSLRGVGWWLGWSLAEFGGFACIALRGIARLQKPAILGQNLFIGLGPVLLYFGLAAFLDRRPRAAAVWTSYGLYAAGIFFGTFLRDDIGMRSILFGAAMVLLALAVGAVIGQVAGELSAVKKPAGMPASERARQPDAATEG